MQLLLPFLIWSLISAIIGGNVLTVVSVIKNPGNGLWFLWDLFYISTIFMLTLYVSHKYKISIILCEFIAFVVLLGFSYIFGAMFECNRIAKLFVFFALGYHSKELRPSKLWAILMIVYLLLDTIWGIDSMLFIPDRFNNLISKITHSQPFSIILSFAGVYALYILFKQWQKKNTINKILSYTGRKTLTIYVFHWVLFFSVGFLDLLPVWFDCSVFNVLFLTSLFVLISVFVDELISINKYLALVLKGRRLT